MTRTATLDCFGDVLTARYNGNVWVAPTNGSQHAHATDAMRVELEAYYQASGEDLDEEADAIEDMLGNIKMPV